MIWNYYQAGHRLDIDNDSAAKLKHDIGEFLAGSLPNDSLQVGACYSTQRRRDRRDKRRED
jgi:hypothetical protein